LANFFQQWLHSRRSKSLIKSAKNGALNEVDNLPKKTGRYKCTKRKWYDCLNGGRSEYENRCNAFTINSRLFLTRYILF